MQTGVSSSGIRDAEEDVAVEGGLFAVPGGVGVSDWLLGASELRMPQAVSSAMPRRPIFRNSSLLFRSIPPASVSRSIEQKG